MKTHISKTILTAIGLLSAGAISFAQAGDDFVLPKESANLYVEVGTAYVKDSIKDEDGSYPGGLNNFYGASVAFGWRIAKAHKVQLETGIYVSSADFNDGDDDKIDATVIPLLVSYSYCIPLAQDGRSELRITPVAGLYNMKFKYSEPGYSESASDAPFAFGLGAGYTYHFSKRFYLDAGYRFLSRGAVKDSDDEGSYTVAKSAVTHWFTVAAGFKF